MTPLHLAARFCSASVVDLLLKAGRQWHPLGFFFLTDVKVRDSEEATPLHWAVLNKDRTVISNNRGDADVESNVDGMELEPLVDARTNDVTIVKLLLDKGADVNAKDAKYSTPLHQAIVKQCSSEVIAKLLDAGADVNAFDENKETPLLCALHVGNNNVVKLLVNKARDVGTDIVKLMIANGADVKAVKMLTHLHIATMFYQSGSEITDLINKGANVDARDDDQRTPLHLAAEYSSNASVIEALLEGGANVDARDKHQCTPLHLACTGPVDKPSMVATLIALKANVHLVDKFTGSPLHWAATCNHQLRRSMLCSKVAPMLTSWT